MKIGSGDSSNGGSIFLEAGETTRDAFSGGEIRLTGGPGTGTSNSDGGNGGSIILDAGIAHGEKDTLDAGGNIEVQAGLSKHGNGGSLIFQSGYGERTSSGAVTISTANAGKNGVSGTISITTGTTSTGDSGEFFCCNRSIEEGQRWVYKHCCRSW